MSNAQAAPREGQGAEQRKIQIRDAGIATHYANFFTIMGGREAILLSFGSQFSSPDTVQLEHKIVLSPGNAKRMAISLGQVIRRYEEEHGEIDINPPRPPTRPGRAEGGD